MDRKSRKAKEAGFGSYFSLSKDLGKGSIENLTKQSQSLKHWMHGLVQYAQDCFIALSPEHYQVQQICKHRLKSSPLVMLAP